MKVLLALDSYKGSLSSWEAGNIAARAIQSVVPDVECEVIPMADGGEGTVDAVVKATNGSYETVRVRGPMGEIADAQIGLVRDKNDKVIAVLEVAGICGLTMVGAGELDPLAATSAGVGEVILQLLDKGIRRFLIGLGGSATNDGGMGMLATLGAEFHDAEGVKLAGSGGDLLRLDNIRLDQLDERLTACSFTIATDVSNPLCGPQGATLVYGRQKGVTEELGPKLDKAMNDYGEKLEAALAKYKGRKNIDEAAQTDKSKVEGTDLVDKVGTGPVEGTGLVDKAGAGAAGGLGFALMAIGGTAVSGAGWIMEMTRLEEQAAKADWVVTGEGRSDRQTLYGKLPFKVAQAAKNAGTGCILISGSLGDGIEELATYFQGCFSIVKEPAELTSCIEQAAPLLERSVREVFRLIHFLSKSE